MREDQSQRRLLREVLKNFIDLWAFGATVVPTLDKELPETLRYAYFAGVGWDHGSFTLDDLVHNLRVPYIVERHQTTQYLYVTLHFSMPPDASENDRIPVGSPLQMHRHPPPLTPDTWLF
jgi:hypothetical protein